MFGKLNLRNSPKSFATIGEVVLSESFPYTQKGGESLIADAAVELIHPEQGTWYAVFRVAIEGTPVTVKGEPNSNYLTLDEACRLAENGGMPISCTKKWPGPGYVRKIAHDYLHRPKHI